MCCSDPQPPNDTGPFGLFDLFIKICCITRPLPEGPSHNSFTRFNSHKEMAHARKSSIFQGKEELTLRGADCGPGGGDLARFDGHSVGACHPLHVRQLVERVDQRIDVHVRKADHA